MSRLVRVKPVEEQLKLIVSDHNKNLLKYRQCLKQQVDRGGRRIYRRSQQDIESATERSYRGIPAICSTTHCELNHTKNSYKQSL